MKNEQINNKVVFGWIESFAISVVFLVASELLQDPLSMKSPYPWIWFAPVLAALRYGLWPSQFSMAILLGGYLFTEPQKIYSISFQLFVLGGFVLSLICICFFKYWSNTIQYSDQLSSYLQNRIQNISHSYKVVLFAYQRLEHSLISKPVTVRSSLNELRQFLSDEHKKYDKEIFYRLLNIIAINIGIEVAGIYKVTKNVVQRSPIATIGKVKPLNADDYLIQECLERQVIAHVSRKELQKGHWSEYLVVAPLVDQEGEIYAILIIEELPFLRLNTESLATINLFLNYFSDGLGYKNAHNLLKKYPDCPMNFANEFLRLMSLYNKTQIDSAIVSFHINPGPHREEYIFALKSQVRGIDSVWETKDQEAKVLLVLMPLSTLVEVEGYRLRIEEFLIREFKIKLNGREIKFKICLFSGFKDPIALINDILDGK